MKYYAVTEDPNELFHYGRLGMKWGQHIFGDKSPAFRRAAKKLRTSTQKAAKSVRKSTMNFANGIKRAEKKWKADAPKRRAARDERLQRNLDRSILKAEAKAAKSTAKANAALANDLARREYKQQRKIQNDVNREIKNEKRSEKRMNKYIQKAREGKLKYGKLSDEQVRRVTERLNLERMARQLGNTEPAGFMGRIVDAAKEGMVQGAARGGAAYIEERMRARGKYKSQKKYGKKMAKEEASAKQVKDREQLKYDRKNAKAQADAEIEREYAKWRAENGEKRTFGEVIGTSRGKRKRTQQHMKEIRDTRKIYDELKKEQQEEAAYQRRMREYREKLNASNMSALAKQANEKNLRSYGLI